MRKRVRVSYRSYAGASSSPWRAPSSGRIVPYVRLSGVWLHEHGFPVGSAVEVVAEPGRLVLRAVEPDTSSPAAAQNPSTAKAA